MSFIIIRTLDIFFQVLELLIVANSVLSMFFAGKSNKWTELVSSMVEPMLLPFRKLIVRLKLNNGNMDFSPILALLTIEFILKPLVLFAAIKLLM